MIDGALSKAFSAINIPPQHLPPLSYIQDIIDYCRQMYSRPVEEVEKEISYWELLDFGPEKVSFKKPIYSKKPYEGWEAICSRCGKRIIVPFKPSSNRAVYCESCLEEIRRTSGDKLSLKNLSQSEVIKVPPKTISAKGEKKKEIPEEKKNKISQILKNIFGQ